MKINLQSIIIYYVIELIKNMIVLWGLVDFPLKKKKNNYLIPLFSIVLIIILTQIFKVDMASLMEIILPILTVFSVTFILDGRLLKKLSYSILTFICIAFFDICVGGILSLFLNLTLKDFTNQTNLNMLASSFAILIFGIASVLKRKRKKHYGFLPISKNIYALIFALACTGVFFVGGLMITSLPGADDNIRKFVLIFILVFSFAAFTVSFMLVFVSKSRDTYKVLSQINQDIIASQQRYYSLANDKQQEIRSIRHEMKNHFSCIDALYRNGKLNEMHEYINQMIGQTEEFEEFFETGNDIVNAILNDAESRYSKEGIRIRLEGAFPKDIKITSMDLCVIFANAINNAIEAIKKINDDSIIRYYIDVKISSYKDDLFIDFINPIGEKVLIEDGRLFSTKQDKSYHGFGTANMKQRVEKYGGTIEYNSESNMFYVHINLRNK